jgi:hypothetical protein
MAAGYQPITSVITRADYYQNVLANNTADKLFSLLGYSTPGVLHQYLGGQTGASSHAVYLPHLLRSNNLHNLEPPSIKITVPLPASPVPGS